MEAGYRTMLFFVGGLSALFVRCQLPTVSTNQCLTTYESYGPERETDYFQTYKYDPTVTTLEDCRSLCDNDQHCKGFGFQEDVLGVRCGLSEFEHMRPAVNCSSCFVYLKKCSSDCITFKEYRYGYIGVMQYANYDPLRYRLCRDRCSNDPACNGFIHNSVTKVCRLVASSASIEYSEDKNFSFSRKECDLGCSTYSNYGMEYILQVDTLHEVHHSNTTVIECEMKCNNESECRGYFVREDWQTCGLSYSARKYKWNGCTTCAAYAKQCPTGNYSIPKTSCTASTYVTYEQNTEASSTYSIFNSTSYAACQTLCTSDQFCQGFAFNSITGVCSLSENMLPKHIKCAECSFSSRECSSTSNGYFMNCSSTFTSMGPNMTVASEFATLNGSDFTTCQQLCVNDSGCLAFDYQPNSQQCYLSKSSTHVSLVCETCKYHLRNCLPGCASVTFISYELGYVLASIKEDFKGQNITFQECQELCDKDTFCFGFAYRSTSVRCVLSESSEPVWYNLDVSVSFSKKVCLPESTTDMTNVQTTAEYETTVEKGSTDTQLLTGTTISQQISETTAHQHSTIEDLTVITSTMSETLQSEEVPVTTTNLNTTESMESSQTTLQISATTEKQQSIVTVTVGQMIISNGSAKCVCFCKASNQTLEESIQQRKNELSINSEVLSSTTRKLTSASDFRPSSQAVGSIGIMIIVGVVAAIVIPDIHCAVLFIFNTYYAKNDTDT